MTALETDRRSFLRTICENPADDVSRLVYADWLEENGERHAAEFIRVQCKAEPTLVPLTSLTGIEYALGCQPHECDRFGNREGSTAITPDSRIFFFSRGFVSRIELPCASFMQHAAALFAEHPITEVRLTDKDSMIVEPTETRWLGHSMWYTWINGGKQSLNPDDRRERARIPREIFDAVLPISPQSFFDEYARFFTVDLANAAISAACVSYGRSLVGLPAISSPHGTDPRTLP